ncbi:MAG: helix-turn-helix transcriptional regulator [Spirochaetaceae bacterium]|nr:helix-turn-helix transcriptional regulator [Spirochaetaceae bacterium]
MKQKLFPVVEQNLNLLGENIKSARLRRRLSMLQVAERAGISRSTLGAVEKGSPSVSLGTYVQVLFVLGLDGDILKVAEDDVLGRKLQDAELLTGRRAPRRTSGE